MKEKITVLGIAVLLLISSCKKKDNVPSVGSWEFEGVKYAAQTAVYSRTDSTLTAASTSAGGSGLLTVYFPGYPHSGSYQVVNYTNLPLDSDKIYIRFINSQTHFYYFSTGGDNASANVVVQPEGKINISVSAQLESYSRPQSDSAEVVVNIVQ